MAKKKAVEIRRSRPAAEPRGGVPIRDPVKFLQDTGLLWHFNTKVLAPLGLGLEVDADADCGWKLMDYRSDPVQVLSAEDFIEGQAKMKRYLKAYGEKTMAVRRERLGFVTQTEKS